MTTTSITYSAVVPGGREDTDVIKSSTATVSLPQFQAAMYMVSSVGCAVVTLRYNCIAESTRAPQSKSRSNVSGAWASQYWDTYKRVGDTDQDHVASRAQWRIQGFLAVAPEGRNPTHYFPWEQTLLRPILETPLAQLCKQFFPFYL